jgi:hypothetical protein
MIEVYITNGDPQNSTAVKDSITHNLTLTAGELTDLLLATNALQTIDITNCGWIIDNTENAIFHFKSNISNLTCCDKGGILDSTSPAYTNLNNVIVSILSRI